MDPLIRLSSKNSPFLQVPEENQEMVKVPFRVTSKKISTLTPPLFEEPILSLVEREVSLEEQVQKVSKELKVFYRTLRSKVPSEAEAELKELIRKINVLFSKDQGLVQPIKEKADALFFSLQFPIALDLKDFTSHLSGLAQETLKTNSLHFFHSLNRTQKNEVLRVEEER